MEAIEGSPLVAMYFFKKKRMVMNGLRKYPFVEHGVELFIVDATKQGEAKKHAFESVEAANDGEQLPMVVFYRGGSVVGTLFAPNTLEEIVEASKPHQRLAKQQELSLIDASDTQEEEK